VLAGDVLFEQDHVKTPIRQRELTVAEAAGPQPTARLRLAARLDGVPQPVESPDQQGG
jgi:hypothetical protein